MGKIEFKTLMSLVNGIYKTFSVKEVKKLSQEIEKIFPSNEKKKSKNLWNEKDFFLITYADSVIKKNNKNLNTLFNFLNSFCKEFNFIHILPFFPSSSDDGFAIIDYKKVDQRNGEWRDFKKISKKFKVMSDLVINHCSSSNSLFLNFLEKNDPGSDYFIFSKKKNTGVSQVIRPRTSDIFKPIKLKDEKGFVWCTFSHDQIDFNFRNPKVLILFLKIIKFYLDNGVKAIRLDAVAFLWKEIGKHLDILNN